MYIHGNFYSKALSRSTAYTVVLPLEPNHQTKCVFLLHGFGSDETAWPLNTPLVQYAETYNAAFFCPDANNSFYTDHLSGENYGVAIGEEFYLEMKKCFNLNFSRENTVIAGFSMGGYGAVLLGLRFSQYYSQIGGFSPAFVFYKKERQEPHYQYVFAKGDYGSENDCLVRYQELLDQKLPIPSITFTCGIDDPLCQQTDLFISALREIDTQALVSFKKEPGFHDFTLWKSDLCYFLEQIRQ